MISGQTGYSLGFGLELSLTIDVGNCPLSSVNRGTWLTKTSLYDLPANHSSRNELGSSNALVSTNGNGSPVGRQAGNYGFLVAKSLHANTPVACVYECRATHTAGVRSGRHRIGRSASRGEPWKSNRALGLAADGSFPRPRESLQPSVPLVGCRCESSSSDPEPRDAWNSP